MAFLLYIFKDSKNPGHISFQHDFKHISLSTNKRRQGMSSRSETQEIHYAFYYMYYTPLAMLNFSLTCYGAENNFKRSLKHIRKHKTLL